MGTFYGQRTNAPILFNKGMIHYVETGSTGTQLRNFGLSRCGAGVFTLSKPTAGSDKYISIESSDFSLQTHSTASVFHGSTANRINATTDLNRTAIIHLIGISSAQWMLDYPLGLTTDAGLSIVASTGVGSI